MDTAKIEKLKAMQDEASLWAQYHMTTAQTGAYKHLNVTRGDGHKLTEYELLQDTLNTARIHILRHNDMAEAILKERHSKSNLRTLNVSFRG